MIPAIKKYCDDCVSEFDTIPVERKIILEKISSYIVSKIKKQKTISLVYICTHNSRRSHFGQVWAAVAANYFNVKNVRSFSGGTEETAFNTNAINALKKAGFEIKQPWNEQNPHYLVFYDLNAEPLTCFSKKYDHTINPTREFAAIMTCSDAEENCPFIEGAELRIATTYEDPKAFDNTPQQNTAYDARCRQIASETLYVFSKTTTML